MAKKNPIKVVKKEQIDWSKNLRIEDAKTTYILGYGTLPFLDLDGDTEYDTLKEAQKVADGGEFVVVVQKTVRTTYAAPFNTSEDDFLF